MTAAAAIAATVACYAMLGILLLCLNFTSLWHWWVKAAAIVLTVAACIGSYFAINGLLGWPAAVGTPERFNLVATRVVEPDTSRGESGHIYLWLEEIDEHQIIIAAPRAFEVPFVLELAFEVEHAQEVLDGGGSILGELDTSSAEVATGEGTAGDDAELDKFSSGNRGGSATGDGARFRSTGSNQSFIFSDMPLVPLPSKPDVQ
ncbi:hypothetical protein [Devosia sp. A449]